MEGMYMKSPDGEITLSEWQKDKLRHHIEYNETQKTLLKSEKAVIYCINRFQRALSLFLQMAGKKKDANGLLQFANKTMHINVGIFSLFCAGSDML